MRSEGHLQVFDLVLRTKSPLFVGCGKTCTKKEYVFEPATGEVIFLDEAKFFTYLAEHNLADEYEGYILRGTSRNLREFLRDVCNISESQMEDMVRVRIKAADALNDDHSLKEIHRFIRDGRGNVYIPGSSIKGALRMVLLKAMILKDQEPNEEKKQYLRQLEDAINFGSKSVRTNPPFDEMYFHSLKLKRGHDGSPKRGDALNSILQGIKVSDSEPISDKNLCLTTKADCFVQGGFHWINLCRESIKPGVEIRCTLTLDQSILRGKITKEDIEQAIAAASEHYVDTVLQRYSQAANVMDSKTILMGGGVGFQSKTILGVAYPEETLSLTARILHKSFFKHNHPKWDPVVGISPRLLKQTVYANAFYPYGVCEVTLK